MGEPHVAVLFLSSVLLYLRKLPKKTLISSTSSLSNLAEIGAGVQKEDAGH